MRFALSFTIVLGAVLALQVPVHGQEATSTLPQLWTAAGKDRQLRPIRWPTTHKVTTVSYHFADEWVRPGDLRIHTTCGGGDIVPLEKGLAKSKVSVEEFKEEVIRGMNAWSVVAAVDFVPEKVPAKAQIIIGFGSQDTDAATTYREIESASIKDGKYDIVGMLICFNRRFRFALQDTLKPRRALTFSIRKLAQHEAGHALGLEHTEVADTEPRDSAMYGLYFDQSDTLGKGDIARARELYGAR